MTQFGGNQHFSFAYYCLLLLWAFLTSIHSFRMNKNTSLGVCNSEIPRAGRCPVHLSVPHFKDVLSHPNADYWVKWHDLYSPVRKELGLGARVPGRYFLNSTDHAFSVIEEQSLEVKLSFLHFPKYPDCPQRQHGPRCEVLLQWLPRDGWFIYQCQPPVLIQKVSPLTK